MVQEQSQCLRARAPAAPVCLNRRNQRRHNGVGGRRTYSTAAASVPLSYASEGRAGLGSMRGAREQRILSADARGAQMPLKPISSNEATVVVNCSPATQTTSEPEIVLSDAGETPSQEFPLLSTAWEFMQAQSECGQASKTAGFGQHWEEWFAMHYMSTSQYKGRNPELYRGVERRVRDMLNFDASLDVNALREKWLEMSPTGRKWRWPVIMLNVMATRPDEALKFMLATCVEPLNHRKHYSDVLDFLAARHLEPSSPSYLSSREDYCVFFDAVSDLLRQYGGSEVAISDFTIIKLFRQADHEQAADLYDILAARGKRMGINTRIKAVDILAKSGATDTAVEILRTLHRDGVSFRRAEVEGVCATLLRASQGDPAARHHEGDIFSLLLQFGLEPKINFYNILSHNAVESGDHETAWKVYEMLLENGIEPSHHTYSILLNDAKWRRDPECLDRILNILRENDIRNEHIANDVLHAMWLMHEKRLAKIAQHNRYRAWDALWHRMLKVYAIYYDTGPLQDFAPEIFDFAHSPSMNEGRKMHPDTPTLNLMVLAALRCKVRPAHITEFYYRYRELLTAGHPDYIKLARTGSVSDAFIARMGDHPKSLSQCMKVMLDMLRTDPTATENQTLNEANKALEPGLFISKEGEPDVPKRIKTPKHKLPMSPPTIRTWTLLMHAFMRQSQPRAAEKVLTMMRQKGVQPDKVTWDTLIMGYSNMRDDSGLVDSIVRSERAGWPINQSLIQGVGGVRKQSGIMGQVIEKMATMGSQREENKVERRFKPGELKLKRMVDEKTLKRQAKYEAWQRRLRELQGQQTQ